MGKCPGCGAQLGKGARFCSLCGTAIPTATPTSPSQQTSKVMPTGTGTRPVTNPTTGAYRAPISNPRDRQRNALLVTGGAITLALVLFLLLKASGVLAAKKTDIPDAAVLAAPQTKVADAPILAAPETKQPEAPVLAPPTIVGNPMPEDVIAYLRWLKKFDAARKSLEGRSEAQVMLTMTSMMVDPLKQAMNYDSNQSDLKPLSPERETEISGLIQEWNKAAQLFQSVNPPNPCATLAANYNGMLTSVIQQQSKLLGLIMDIVKNTSGNSDQSTDTLKKMLPSLVDENKNKYMSKEIDSAFANSDDALNAVRGQYTNIPEDIDQAHFQIKDESSTKVPDISIPGF